MDNGGLVRANFDEWLCIWRMTVSVAYKFKADLLKFAQKAKANFEELIENEI